MFIAFREIIHTEKEQSKKKKSLVCTRYIKLIILVRFSIKIVPVFHFLKLCFSGDSEFSGLLFFTTRT